MQTLPSVPCANVFVKSSPTMQIPVQLIIPSHTMKAVDIRALIDSGASISCIDWGFVRKHKLPTQRLKTSIQARNADNSINSKGVIQFSTTLFLDVGGIARRITFHILSLGNENVILGLPWLKEVNPTINWVERTLSIKESLDQSQELFCSFSVDTKQHESCFIRPSVKPPHHTNVNAIVDQHLFAYNNWETENEYIVCARQNRAIHRIIRCGSRFIPAGSPIIAKLTTATELTAPAEQSKPKPMLPSEYSSFASVFSKEATDHVPPFRAYDHKINLDEAFTPKIGKVYPLSPDERKATEDFLDENLAFGKICPSNSPQASPFFFVKKKDGGLRPCQDYRYVNEHTIRDAYPLPLISDLVNKLRDAKVFTKFDVRWGYNNVRIKDGHQWKVAFVTHKGLFEPTVMFFGLTNSPATFERFMNNSFRDMIAEGWLVIYMDDLLIYSPDTTLHEERTKRVLQCMTKLDLHLKLEKCKFATDEVEYLRMIVKPGQLAMDPVKLNGIASWPTPTKVKDVRSFLGFANFYCRFIPDYSNVACPLIDLTKKNLTWNWSPSCQSAFEALKHLFLSKPVLHLPDLTTPFAVATDTSKYASGAILLQTDSNGDWHPCSYLSQSFSPAERNYDIYDRELLAVIRALKSWRHYLHGSPFPVQVFTDHKNLTYFRQPQALNRRQAWWLIDLADFNLKMIHVPGKLLAGPDALSCRPDLLPANNDDNTGVTLLPPFLFMNLINTTLSQRIESASAGNPLVLQALQSMHADIPLPFRSRLADWQVEAGILTYKGHVYVPADDSLRHTILEWCHDHESAGHPGFLKTCQLVAAEFWWPGLASFVCRYVKGCATCQQNKTNTHPTVPPLSPIKSSASRPFQQISCDLITDLPVSVGFDSLLVMVDHGLTKGVILCPTKKTITAKGITSLFFHKVFLRFGLYDKVISDCGPQFASSFAQELGKLLKYDLSLSTAYHPQSDGETERVNQEVKTYLRIFCRSNPGSWAENISHAEFTHNHRPHSVTNQSPFYLMMGYEPHTLPSVISDTAIPAIETRLKTLSAARNEALAAHELAQQVMAARSHRSFIPFKLGDKVWLEARNLKCLIINPVTRDVRL